MTITNGYGTLDELKHPSRLNILSSDSFADEMLEGILEDASREMDASCHRWFYTDADSDEPQTFYYTPRAPGYLFVDDIRTTTGLEISIDINGDGVYDVTLDSDDYILEPANAPNRAEPEPFQKIVLRATSQTFVPGIPNGVRVKAHYGWPAVPAKIKQATLLWAERQFKRFATPIGSESMTALGKQTISIPGDDPDVARKISRYKKVVFG